MSHRLVVLISGSGTNLQAIIDAVAHGKVNADIALVVSNRAGAKGLERASAAAIETCILAHQDFPDRESFDRAMIKEIDKVQPDTIVLAGFMRILSDTFVRHYAGRLINIHPSLLPLYPGLNTHQRAIDAGDQQHGCSIHFVTEELDGGPVIAQAVVPVRSNDTPESLSNRVQLQEHALYPLVLNWRSEGRVILNDQGVQLDGETLSQQGYQHPWQD